MMNHSEDYLTRDEERLLLQIARDALTVWITENNRIDLDEYPLTPALQEKHGAFVTLHNQGQLRGCIGYIANREPLAITVRDNAINAAAFDYRFPAVTACELPDIVIDISALTPGDAPDSPLRLVKDVNEISIGRDGLYIESLGKKGGLLLPQVAVEHNWSLEDFLQATCRKAGLDETAWRSPETKIFRFSAQVFSEDDSRNA